MSSELIAIPAVGVGLAGLVVTSQRNLWKDLPEETRLAERLSEGRRVSGDAA